ncbi:MFS transporter [Streptomyces sp. NPDC002130]
MGAARASREAVLPLWALHLGLDAAQVSVIFGIGAAVDLLCSYPAGHIMDRYGRRLVAVPSLTVIGVSYLMLPFSTGALGLTVVAVVMGIGNGLGNGVIMTLGADIAPPEERAEFLAAWRLTHDTGMFGGPLAIGLLAAVFPLGWAFAALGATSFAGAAMMFRFIPIYSPRVSPRSRVGKR